MSDEASQALMRGLVPVPDPTTLTTQLVDRAIRSHREVVDTRLAGMDTATNLLNQNVGRLSEAQERNRTLLREDVDRQFVALREAMTLMIDGVSAVASERFTAIAGQFSERDTRQDQTEKERGKSLDAALAAAKEAVAEQQKANALAIGKSEDGTKEKLQALETLMVTSVSAISDKIDDLKERLTRLETSGSARTEVKTEQRLNLGQAMLAVSIVIAAIALVVGLN